VRGVQEAGVIGLGEALAPVFAGAAAGMHAVDQPGPLPGLEVSQLPVWPGSAERRAAGVAQ
jgi:hypothetical protein